MDYEIINIYKMLLLQKFNVSQVDIGDIRVLLFALPSSKATKTIIKRNGSDIFSSWKYAPVIISINVLTGKIQRVHNINNIIGRKELEQQIKDQISISTSQVIL